MLSFEGKGPGVWWGSHRTGVSAVDPFSPVEVLRLSRETQAAAGEGAADETRKSKFTKRTWNVLWNQRDIKSMWGKGEG